MKKVSILNILRDKAFLCGVEAYKAGKRAIPCIDKNLMGIIGSDEARALEFGCASEILKSWTQGWTKAHLNNTLTFTDLYARSAC